MTYGCLSDVIRGNAQANGNPDVVIRKQPRQLKREIISDEVIKLSTDLRKTELLSQDHASMLQSGSQDCWAWEGLTAAELG